VRVDHLKDRAVLADVAVISAVGVYGGVVVDEVAHVADVGPVGGNGAGCEGGYYLCGSQQTVEGRWLDFALDTKMLCTLQTKVKT
jgi:hypothetical protein